MYFSVSSVTSCLISSKLQARAEVEHVALDAIADAEVVNPARAKIEVALTQLCGVGNDRANAESPTGKNVERDRCASVVVDLLNPAFDKPDAEAILESFDGQHLQVGQDAVLIMRCVILRIEFHLPDAGQFNIRLWDNLCVGDAGNERPGVRAEVDKSTFFERSSRCPKCETKGQMISLAKVMACYDRSKHQIEQAEGAVGFPDRERAKGKVGLDL